jgi:CRISPR-associated protein Cmr3
LIRATEKGAQANLPLPLPFLPAAAGHPGKEELPHWMRLDDFEHYLAGNPLTPCKAPELWETEHRIGIAIDPETHGTVEGQIYAAEHLRLRDDVRLRFAVSTPGGRQRNRPGFATEGNKTVNDLCGVALTLGGERRFGVIQDAGVPLALPDVSAHLSGVLVKWVLLTPAIFKEGWLPGWIQAQGQSLQVRLTILPDASGYPQQTREQRRAAMQSAAQPIAAELLAACVGKPQTITGWDLLESGQTVQGQPTRGRAKPAWLAVPSGSVYYFRAADNHAAKLLVQTLQGRCHSDSFGEKGMGLGVCGVFTLNTDEH